MWICSKCGGYNSNDANPVCSSCGETRTKPRAPSVRSKIVTMIGQTKAWLDRTNLLIRIPKVIIFLAVACAIVCIAVTLWKLNKTDGIMPTLQRRANALATQSAAIPSHLALQADTLARVAKIPLEQVTHARPLTLYYALADKSARLYARQAEAYSHMTWQTVQHVTQRWNALMAIPRGE